MFTSDEITSAESTVNELRACYTRLREAIATVIVGQEAVVKTLAAGLISNGHMLMTGVPGLAKTLMVKALAKSLGWSFHRIQFTPDLMPADITGTEILQSDSHGGRRELVFQHGPIFANLILADEINRTPPKTQAALLEAMQEHAVTVSGVTYQLEPPFVVVATQNPIEQEGTYPLPEAQLDRFMFSIYIDYPSSEEEIDIAARPARMELPEITPIAERETFVRYARIVDEVPVSRHVLEYAVALTTATRPKGKHADGYISRYVAWGAGPRATQHLITAAKAMALLDGRPAPECRDIRDVVRPVLRHRIIPNYNALGEGIDSDSVLQHLLATVMEAES